MESQVTLTSNEILAIFIGANVVSNLLDNIPIMMTGDAKKGGGKSSY